MKKWIVISLLLLPGCKWDTPTSSLAKPARQPEPIADISPVVGGLAAPLSSANNVTRRLEARVALLERERADLKADAAAWEAEMQRWQAEGVTLERQLELTLSELHKVRANYFKALEETIPALKEENANLKSALAEAEAVEAQLIKAAAEHDKQEIERKKAAEEDAKTIGEQNKTIEDKDKAIEKLKQTIADKDVEIGRLKHYREIIMWIAIGFAVYIILRLLARSAKMSKYLAWIP